MLYTKSAAARILDIKASRIVSVELVGNRVLVVYKTDEKRSTGNKNKLTKGSTFVSKADFKRDFVAYRKASAIGLVSHRVNATTYSVLNPASAEGVTTHLVTLTQTGLACTCDDYANQVEAFGGKGCCKHGYNVLSNWLGLGSLNDYLALTQPQTQAA